MFEHLPSRLQCFYHLGNYKLVVFPGEKPQRILEDLQGSLKILKDLQKIFEDEDLSRILEGSLKVL